jgi:hypothetical protein
MSTEESPDRSGRSPHGRAGPNGADPVTDPHMDQLDQDPGRVPMAVDPAPSVGGSSGQGQLRAAAHTPPLRERLRSNVLPPIVGRLGTPVPSWL